MESNKNLSLYTTDGKVKHFSTEDDINIKLGKIIGPRFVEYRKLWDKVEKEQIVTEFPLFLHILIKSVITNVHTV